jgi:hypothetical protein
MAHEVRILGHVFGMWPAVEIEHPPDRLVLEDDRHGVGVLHEEEGKRRREAA